MSETGEDKRAEMAEMPDSSRNAPGGTGKTKDKKIPCWKLKDCSVFVYKNCPAYLHPEKPCWDITETSAEILTGLRKNCKLCRVWDLYHHLPAYE